MLKASLLLLLALTACSSPVEAPSSCQDPGTAATAAWLAAIPPGCFQHVGKEYLGGGLACVPGEAPTCGLDFGQKQTPDDGSGNPIVFLCNCMSTGEYSCLYVGVEVGDGGQ